LACGNTFLRTAQFFFLSSFYNGFKVLFEFVQTTSGHHGINTGFLFALLLTTRRGETLRLIVIIRIVDLYIFCIVHEYFFSLGILVNNFWGCYFGSFKYFFLLSFSIDVLVFLLIYFCTESRVRELLWRIKIICFTMTTR